MAAGYSRTAVQSSVNKSQVIDKFIFKSIFTPFDEVTNDCLIEVLTLSLFQIPNIIDKSKVKLFDDVIINE